MKTTTKHLKGTMVELCEDDINIKDFIYSKLHPVEHDEKDAFFVCNIGDIVKKWKKFQHLLPQVQPFYAVKCNPDAMVLKLLADLGANFDCASKGEITTILEMGIAPERIIFANPCKQTSHIKYAKANNVNLMTFDNEVELHKIKQHCPNAELIIRIKVDDSKSLCKFGIKFGICPSEAKRLLNVAWDLGLNVIGVSFHVGSGCFDASHYYEAVKSARFVFDQGRDIGYNFHLLDIGGGFPGTNVEQISFEDVVCELSRAFGEYFPPGNGIKIIAEPGRYFVASAFTSICNITSVREVTTNEGSSTSEERADDLMYYINDGVYGSFNCIFFDHQFPIPYPLKKEDGPTLYKCSVWGPTCDSLDCISSSSLLPKMEVGDWICFDNMGAYTLAAASKFNGFKKPTAYYMCHQSLMDKTPKADSYYPCKKSVEITTHVLPITTVF